MPRLGILTLISYYLLTTLATAPLCAQSLSADTTPGADSENAPAELSLVAENTEPTKEEKELALSSKEHLMEELGVNTYTTPKIQSIFTKLERLGPLPVDKIPRRISKENYTNRIQIALCTGTLIAEGFITVQTEDRKELEEIGRQIRKRAISLGVGKQVTSHSKKLIELGLTGDWAKLKKQLTATQKDVEQAMVDLRDEQIAHMVALGGWLRGLEVAAIVIDQKYSEPRAALLNDIDLIDYFIDRLNTLHPQLKKTPLVIKVSSELKVIQSLMQENGQAKKIYPSDVKEILKRVTEINNSISKPTSLTDIS